MHIQIQNNVPVLWVHGAIKNKTGLAKKRWVDIITKMMRWAHITVLLCSKYQQSPFLAFSVLLHRVEKIPSVQSLVATSSRPNICGAVIAFGFILSSLCGSPQSVMAFISTWMQQVLPAPDGPRVIIPWRTRWVSNSYRSLSDIWQLPKPWQLWLFWLFWLRHCERLHWP